MKDRMITIVLLVGLVFSVSALTPKLASMRWPGNQQGYEPEQPVAFSHRLHCTELEISCVYCHSGAEKSRHAGIPAASVCMNCHKAVTAPLAVVRAEEEAAKEENRKPRFIASPELQKLYDALALNNQLLPDSTKTAKPIAWVRVHKMPDFACFDHRAHVAAEVTCQSCHGPVETMERVRQVSDLSMGWCVNCHRETNRTGVAGKTVKASLDCATCHY
jgi:hypothetical protein